MPSLYEPLDFHSYAWEHCNESLRQKLRPQDSDADGTGCEAALLLR